MGTEHNTKRTFLTRASMVRSMAMIAFGLSAGHVEATAKASAEQAEEIDNRLRVWRSAGIIGSKWRWGRNAKNHGPRSPGSIKRSKARRFARARGRRMSAC